MREQTQFFDVTVSSKSSKNGFTSANVTDWIQDGLKLDDEDGLIKKLSFTMIEGHRYLDIFAIGMDVSLTGGDISQNANLFTGTISMIIPDFADSGEISLTIECQGSEGQNLGRASKDIVYPSKNHDKSWGSSPTTYAGIIINLCKDADFEVLNENISVTKDRDVTFKSPVRQKNKTDWEFMQQLAKDIRATLWVQRIDNKDHIFLKDNTKLVATISNKTFFYLARTDRSNFIDMPVQTPNKIQFISATVNLDTRKNKITQTTNPVTGKTEVSVEVENGSVGERWVLDESKLRGLSSAERQNLMNLFMDGKISWEGSESGEVSAKKYFKLAITEESSRTATSNNIEVEVSGEVLNADGVTTKDGKVENTGRSSYKTVIDKDKISKLSSEERAGIMGRIARGDMTEKDKTYYTVVDTTPVPEKTSDSSKSEKPLATEAPTGIADKRDAGFKIEANIYGRLDIQTKKSYILEGLGKYSDKYYLYGTVHEWGKTGWNMKLTFVK